MTDDSSYIVKKNVGKLLAADELPSHRHTWSSVSSACMPSSTAGILTFPRQQIDIASLREEIRQELIAENSEKSSLKEPTKERMKRKLDQVLDEAKTDE